MVVIRKGVHFSIEIKIEQTSSGLTHNALGEINGTRKSK